MHDFYKHLTLRLIYLFFVHLLKECSDTRTTGPLKINKIKVTEFPILDEESIGVKIVVTGSTKSVLEPS